jgi:hypothetical protein
MLSLQSGFPSPGLTSALRGDQKFVRLKQLTCGRAIGGAGSKDRPTTSSPLGPPPTLQVVSPSKEWRVGGRGSHPHLRVAAGSSPRPTATSPPSPGKSAAGLSPAGEHIRTSG